MSTSTTHIHWFRNDLRVSDQPFISELNVQHHFGVYLIDPSLFAQLPWGFRKTGIHRAAFLRSQLSALQTTYRKLGSDILVLYGKPEEVLPELVAKYNATLSFQLEYATEELTVQTRILQKIPKNRVFTYHGNFLVHPKMFSFHEFPKSFSGFRKKVEKLLPNVQRYPEIINSLPASTEVFQTIRPNCVSLHPKTVFPFNGGELAGHKRLKHYLGQTRKIDHYKRTRNGLLGTDYSSKMSPWLSSGALSVSHVYAELYQYEQLNGANEGTKWFIFELLWRDYFRHAGKYYQNKLFRASGLTNAPSTGKMDKALFNKWASGETGNNFIDANMRELFHTGYISNRGRQNAASYLVHDLGLDWRWGAAWFEHHLLDYDVYSNQGNWMYIAGLGFNPKGKSVFDIHFQSQHYDPKGDYSKQWEIERII